MVLDGDFATRRAKAPDVSLGNYFRNSEIAGACIGRKYSAQLSFRTASVSASETIRELALGGLTTKIHPLANQHGEPIDFRITGGQVNDCTQAIDLLGQRPAEAVIADKGYDADSIVAHIAAMQATAVIGSNIGRVSSVLTPMLAGLSACSLSDPNRPESALSTCSCPRF
jgi:hypothetical protein